MNRQTTFVALFAAVAIAMPAAAQEVTNLPIGARQSVAIDLGLQSAFVTRATYSRHVGPGVLYGRFTFPFLAPDVRDLAFEAGGQATVIGWGNWKLQASLAPVVRLTENSVFSATALGARAALFPGYQGDRWGVVAELGYEKMVATHLSHSSLYRRVGYPGAHRGDGTGVLGGLVQHEVGPVPVRGPLHARQHGRGVEPAEDLAVGDDRRLARVGLAEAAPQLLQLGGVG